MTTTLLQVGGKPKVTHKCPHCGKANPEVQALTLGESTDSMMIGFVPSCCQKVIGIQMCSKVVPQAEPTIQ